MRPKRVFGYARVSSIEQAQGTSLGDQQASIAAYAKASGLKVDRFFVESESGGYEKAEKREQMLALMATVKAGDLVLCDKVDRWSRDPAFTYTSLRTIMQAGAKFYAVSDQMDPSTDAGDSMLNIRVLVAREEHKRIRERLIGTRVKIRDAGYYVEGVVPFGYQRPVGVKGVEKNILQLHEVNAPVARRMFEMSASGFGTKAIIEATGHTKDRIHSVLHSRFHTGVQLNSQGVWMKGRHPAIVSQGVFEKSEARLMARRHGGARPRDAASQTDTWIMRDVVHCLRCGARVSAAYGGEPYWRVDYYRCRQKKVCLSRLTRRDQVEPLFAEQVATRLLELRDELSREPAAPKSGPSVVDSAERRIRLLRKRERIVEAFTDGAMERDAMRAAVTKVDGELAKLEEAEKPAKQPTRKMRRAMLGQVDALRKAWDKAPPKVRRDIVNLVTEKALIARDETPVPTWRPYDEMLEQA